MFEPSKLDETAISRCMFELSALKLLWGRVKRLRLYNQIYAFSHSYFWLPCPICGRKFGGHERPQGILMINPAEAKGTCSACASEVERRNQIMYAKWGINV
jgi:hypothetical protein